MFVYVLKCDENNFFIAATSNRSKLEPKFKLKLNAEWLEGKKIESVHEIIESPEEYTYQKFKNYYVVKYMKMYGFDKVRGGSWTRTQIPNHGQNLISRVLELIDLESEISEISRIYENQLRLLNTEIINEDESRRAFFISSVQFEETVSRKQFYSCPLCRSSQIKETNPKLYKSIENECVICMENKCQIICEKCMAPSCCFMCYQQLKPIV